jgi:hypothetical protein
MTPLAEQFAATFRRVLGAAVPAIDHAQVDRS